MLGLLRSNPFPDRPPRYVRAQYYTYRFTTPAERRRTGRWWTRELIGIYYPAVSLGKRKALVLSPQLTPVDAPKRVAPARRGRRQDPRSPSPKLCSASRMVGTHQAPLVLRRPPTSSTAPATIASAPSTGGSGSVCCRSAVAWTGPMSITVSRLV